MEKLPEMAPNGARNCFSPTNPKLANIFDRTDIEFENGNFVDSFWFPDFQTGPGLWASLGRALTLGQAGFGPRAPQGPRSSLTEECGSKGASLLNVESVQNLEPNS